MLSLHNQAAASFFKGKGGIGYLWKRLLWLSLRTIGCDGLVGQANRGFASRLGRAVASVLLLATVQGTSLNAWSSARSKDDAVIQTQAGAHSTVLIARQSHSAPARESAAGRGASACRYRSGVRRGRRQAKRQFSTSTEFGYGETGNPGRLEECGKRHSKRRTRSRRLTSGRRDQARPDKARARGERKVTPALIDLP